MQIQKKLNSRRLNLNVADAISEFEAMMKEFRLKKDIYRILFRGKGLEFESYRDYAPDDDATDIDWKASARTEKLLVKQYKEERDLKIMFLVDVGENMVFGSSKKLKCEYIAELVSAFARVIMDNNDRVGFIFFSDGIKHFIDPRGGDKHFQLLVDMLSRAENYGGVTNINESIDYAMRYLDRSINSVIVVSDFLRATPDTEKKLSLLSHRFETMIIRVRDLLDITLPDVEGEVVVQNSQTDEQIIINPKIAKKVYERYAQEQAKFVEDMFKKVEADYLDLITNVSFSLPLALFLKERVERGFA
ncbi:MAG TPA: DUF58 domain-containing protein [Candidatus Nanoarchaeia archaeon]|nr:DUF58 domain-containing protein [Candidatus Nanoarchaeia archaeon]